MQIIDAHLHAQHSPGFQALCRQLGLENTWQHLQQTMAQNQVCQAVAMGSSHAPAAGGVPLPGVPDLPGLPARAAGSPGPLFYCLGVNPQSLAKGCLPQSMEQFAREIARPGAVGFKLYPGYQPLPPSDPVYDPIYQLAEQQGVPVVIHTGDTARASGRLRYAHPLWVDEVAVRFPRVQLVIAHAGNPWILDACEVAKKNENVCLDLSGLATGRFSAEEFCRRYEGYVQTIRTWLGYLDDGRKVLYGSDWPLVDMASNIALVRLLVPPQWYPDVFAGNARRVFALPAPGEAAP